MKKRISLALACCLGMLLSGWCQTGSDIGFLTKTGAQMPDFKVQMLDGNMMDTKTLRGKVILLDFWGAKCGGCLLEMKRFPKEIIAVYGARKDFVLLPIEAQGHSEAEIKKTAERLGFTFPLAFENGQDIAGLFFNRAMGLPRTLIIDRQGKIVYQAFGYNEKEFAGMLKALEQTINEKK